MAAQTPLVSRSRWIIASLSASVLLSSLGTSIANVALPRFTEVFGASFQQVQWIVLAYLMAITTLIVTVGRFGDIFGRRRLLLAGIMVFTVSSGLCGLAPSLPMLIAARALQGTGAAVMLALTMTFVADTVPKDRVGSAMGVLGTMSAIGTALGPSLGGVLIAGFDWRAIFFVNLPLGALSLFFAHRYLPADLPKSASDRVRIDFVGMLLLGLSLGLYALAMTQGHGSFGAANWALLSGSALGVAIFIAAELKTTAPLIRMSLFANPVLSAGFAMSALVSAVVMSTLIVGPFYLSRGLGLDAAVVGAILSIGPIIAALTGIPAGRSVDRFGAGWMTIAGLVAVAGGAVALSQIPMSFGVLGYIGPIAVVTAGYALFQAANNTSVMADLPTDQRGVVSGMLNLSRNLGLVTGAAVLGSVFARASATADMTTAAPQAIANGMHATVAAAAGLASFALVLAVKGATLHSTSQANL